jgi:hypothetical protein
MATVISGFKQVSGCSRSLFTLRHFAHPRIYDFQIEESNLARNQGPYSQHLIRWSGMLRLAMDKQSSPLGQSVSYEENEVLRIRPRESLSMSLFRSNKSGAKAITLDSYEIDYCGYIHFEYFYNKVSTDLIFKQH